MFSSCRVMLFSLGLFVSGGLLATTHRLPGENSLSTANGLSVISGTLLQSAFPSFSLKDCAPPHSPATPQIHSGQPDEAVATWRSTLAEFPNNFQAAMLMASHLRASGDLTAYNRAIRRLDKSYPRQVACYRALFSWLDTSLEAVWDSAPIPVSDQHAIVVLGYALSPQGQMQAPLLDRLAKALSAAKKYPSALIVVSGGAAKKGVTEAALMKSYLVGKGVAAHRIVTEEQSAETVENAIHVMPVLKKRGIHSVTLVTHASHIRRALAIFMLAARKEGLNVTYGHDVVMDSAFSDKSSVIPPAERIVINRDTMRLAGLWVYPKH